ncbi:MAG: ShlB/FhaC/HecB family hemolysin secretion/activation protein [Pseudomonadales bacterium]
MRRPYQTALRVLFLLPLWLSTPALSQAPVDPGAIEPQSPAQPLRAPAADPIRVPAPAERSPSQEAGPRVSVSGVAIAWEEPDAIAAAHKHSANLLLRDLLQEKNHSLTIGELDALADALTEHLRGAGYLLAKAILPPQQIEQGNARLRVFAGIVGDVIAKSNELYSERHITGSFESLRAAPVQRKTLEPRLLLLNELPGLNAVAVFEPGRATGTTTLALQTTAEYPVRYSARVDNHGIEATGDWRLGLGATVNNVTGHRDALSVNAIKTFSPGDLRNARLRYEITTPGLVHTVGLGYSETRYDVEQSAVKSLNIEGDTEISELDVRSRWYNSRALSIHSELGVATKRAEVLFLGGANSDGVDRLTVLSARLVAEGVDQRLRGIYRASIGLDRGFNDLLGSMSTTGNGNSLTRDNGAQSLPGQFRSINASFNRLQYLAEHQNLLLLFTGQYSDDQLASLEKMSLGGPYTVRAYPVGEFTADRALYSSVAWQISGGMFSDGIAFGEYAWSQVLSLSLFADYSWGKSRSGAVGGAVTRRELSGFGLGARVNFPGQRAFMDISAAKPFAGKEANNGDGEQFWIQLGMDF